MACDLPRIMKLKLGILVPIIFLAFIWGVSGNEVYSQHSQEEWAELIFLNNSAPAEFNHIPLEFFFEHSVGGPLQRTSNISLLTEISNKSQVEMDLKVAKDNKSNYSITEIRIYKINKIAPSASITSKEEIPLNVTIIYHSANGNIIKANYTRTTGYTSTENKNQFNESSSFVESIYPIKTTLEVATLILAAFTLSATLASYYFGKKKDTKEKKKSGKG